VAAGELLTTSSGCCFVAFQQAQIAKPDSSITSDSQKKMALFEKWHYGSCRLIEILQMPDLSIWEREFIQVTADQAALNMDFRLTPSKGSML
jgi:hypothetical protein